jgi:hypothetical protein
VELTMTCHSPATPQNKTTLEIATRQVSPFVSMVLRMMDETILEVESMSTDSL